MDGNGNGNYGMLRCFAASVRPHMLELSSEHAGMHSEGLMRALPAPWRGGRVSA
jgi:hypothetical protein